ncbi:MAG: metallophosphoesterase [Clostridium sp.]|nr:metallophosphoesterase [Clostridium sp.]
MLYLISDIHGNLNRFKKLLKKIAFDSKKDNLIILGDVLDRGPYGIALLEYLMPLIEDGAAKLLLGNHEMFCCMYIEGTLDGHTWSAFGGEDTLKAVKKMTGAKQEELRAFLRGLPLYAKSHSVHLGDFICTHAGLHADYLVRDEDGTIRVAASVKEAYEKAPYHYMCGRDLHDLPHADKQALDKFMVVGHVPCNRLRDGLADHHFVRTPYYMDIDAGSGHAGGKLGCYIVDTDEEVYV